MKKNQPYQIPAVAWGIFLVLIVVMIGCAIVAFMEPVALTPAQRTLVDMHRTEFNNIKQ